MCVQTSHLDLRLLAKRYPRKQRQQIRLCLLADIGDFPKIAQIYLKFLFSSAKLAALNEILNFVQKRHELAKFYLAAVPARLLMHPYQAALVSRQTMPVEPLSELDVLLFGSYSRF